MAAPKSIKLKIRSVAKTQKVTKAMEAVSASKMRKAQARAFAGRAYSRAAVEILARVSGSRELKNHPLTRGVENATNMNADVKASSLRVNEVAFSKPYKALYIVITSDKGLAGALNSAVLRAAYADITAHGLTPANVSVIAIGRKANDFFIARGFTVELYHQNTDEVNDTLISKIVTIAAVRFGTRAADVVKIVYQNFISTFEQRPTLRTIFPLSLIELEKVVGDIKRMKVGTAPNGETRPATYTIEPSEEAVLAAILPRLASIFVYHALLESQASEHSARMVSMKSASDKAGELTESLTLVFNKARQAAITREVSEITGGIEAMAA